MKKRMMLIINPMAGRSGYKNGFGEVMNILDSGGYLTTVHESAWGVSEKSKLSSISTNTAGFCVKKPWNPQRIPRLFALHPACVCEISVIFFVFRYNLNNGTPPAAHGLIPGVLF